MHFSLVLVGAHDGSGMESLIQQAETEGNVLLIEPVPFLFDKLKSRYAIFPKVILRSIAISTKDGEVEFTAPKETANSIASYGDQLGSLVPDHASGHDARMSQHIEVIKVHSSSFETLVKAEKISSIHTLFTDMEGMDAEVLPTFPFSTVIPMRIIFEFKHSDGLYRVGRKFANALIFLEDRGYRVNVLDEENMVATHESFIGSEPFRPSGGVQKIAMLIEEIRAKNERLAATEQRLHATAEQLAAMEQRFRATSEQLGATEQHLAATEQRLHATSEQLGATEQRLAATERHLAAEEQQLAAVYASTSWRVTAPLRSLFRSMRSPFRQ